MRRSITGLLCLAALAFGITARITAQITAQKSTAKRTKITATEARLRDKSRAARLEYDARARRLAKNDVVGHFALARWCTKKGLPRCARWELHEVLREAPDHVGARSRMGQAFHDGKWLPKEVAMKAKGYVPTEAGHWVRKYDAARRRGERDHRVTVQHQANLLFTRLADRDSRTRAAARHELETLARREKLPDLLRVVRRKAAEYDEYWRARRGAYTTYTGLLSVNATLSTLESLDTFTTSLGVGAPVRLQLPRMKTISVHTTVAVPLGLRR
jgi:hypothetical protein